MGNSAPHFTDMYFWPDKQPRKQQHGSKLPRIGSLSLSRRSLIEIVGPRLVSIRTHVEECKKA